MLVDEIEEDKKQRQEKYTLTCGSYCLLGIIYLRNFYYNNGVRKCTKQIFQDRRSLIRVVFQDKTGTIIVVLSSHTLG